jgi:hypothetical protein
MVLFLDRFSECNEVVAAIYNRDVGPNATKTLKELTLIALLLS